MSERFNWSLDKEQLNFKKHGVDFHHAKLAFLDPGRKIYKDEQHSSAEERFFCFGKVGGRVLTVRFTYRDGVIRIIGAGFWRKGEKVYEEKTR